MFSPWATILTIGGIGLAAAARAWSVRASLNDEFGTTSGAMSVRGELPLGRREAAAPSGRDAGLGRRHVGVAQLGPLDCSRTRAASVADGLPALAARARRASRAPVADGPAGRLEQRRPVVIGCRRRANAASTGATRDSNARSCCRSAMPVAFSRREVVLGLDGSRGGRCGRAGARSSLTYVVGPRRDDVGPGDRPARLRSGRGHDSRSRRWRSATRTRSRPPRSPRRARHGG